MIDSTGDAILFVVGVLVVIVVLTAVFASVEKMAKKNACKWCGGRGYSYGHSPLDRLDTFRHARDHVCYYCYGTGKARDDDGAMPAVTAIQAARIFGGLKD